MFIIIQSLRAFRQPASLVRVVVVSFGYVVALLCVGWPFCLSCSLPLFSSSLLLFLCSSLALLLLSLLPSSSLLLFCCFTQVVFRCASVPLGALFWCPGASLSLWGRLGASFGTPLGLLGPLGTLLDASWRHLGHRRRQKSAQGQW